MKRVLIVQNSLRTVYLFRLGYINKLIERSVTVVIIAPNDDPVAYQKLTDLGVILHTVKVGVNKLSLLKSVLLMNVNVIRERIKYEPVIICHFLVTFISCFISVAPFNKRLIVYTEGLGSVFSRSPFARKILKFFLSKENFIRIFCNESERSMLGKHNDIVSHGIGIEIANFKPCGFDSLQGSNRRELLYLGRLVADKGFFDAVEVLRTLLSQGHDVVLNVVGDFYPSNPSSITKIDKMRLEEEFGEHISFVGFSNNVRYWYAKSHILLLPSVREGFPVSVMEASAMGVPTLGYQVPGMTDAVLDGVNGKLVKFKDIDSLSSEAEYILSDKNTQRNLFYSSCAYAEKNFARKKKDKFLADLIEGLF